MKRAPTKPKPSKPGKISAPPPIPTINTKSYFGPSTLIPIYICLILIGYFFIQSGKATIVGNEFSSQRSLFTAVNAATLTGFSQPINMSEYTTMGQAIAITLTIAGMLFSFIAGGIAVARIARMPYSDRQIIPWSVGSIIGAALIGSALSIFYGASSIFQCVSAFANSGLYTGILPTKFSSEIHFVLLPLAILGGLGLPVLMELFEIARGKQQLSQHSRTVLIWTSSLFLISTTFMLLLQLPGTTASAETWRRALETASCQAVNVRSAGFSFDFAKSWPRVIQWTTIGLMIIGGSSAGTAGGLKITTLAIIFTGTRATLKRQSPGRPLGIALTWLTIYTGLLAASHLALLATAPQLSADEVFFLATSALGNVGLSHDPVSIPDSALSVLSATMLLGRVVPVLILWWMVQSTPEAKVAIG